MTSMTSHSESLFFSLTTRENFGQILAYRSNYVKARLGQSIFDYMEIPPSERDFYIRNLYRFGTCPMLISHNGGIALVERSLLYSLNLCCFIDVGVSSDCLCRLADLGSLGEFVISESIGALSPKEPPEQSELIAAFVSVSRIVESFSALNMNSHRRDFYVKAKNICSYMGCSLDYEEALTGFGLVPQDITYSNQVYSFSVFATAFVARMICDERMLFMRVRGKDIFFSVKCNPSPEIENIFLYLESVCSHLTDTFIFHTKSGELFFAICPFFDGNRLCGVKNPIKLTYNITNKHQPRYAAERRLSWQTTDEDA